MTVHNKTPVTMAEVREIVDDLEEKKEIKAYLKTFTKLKKEKSAELKKDIIGLNNMKMREEHVVKIVDFVPKDVEDLNKILGDVSLSEEEINAILEITKKY